MVEGEVEEMRWMRFPTILLLDGFVILIFDIKDDDMEYSAFDFFFKINSEEGRGW